MLAGAGEELILRAKEATGGTDVVSPDTIYGKAFS